MSLFFEPSRLRCLVSCFFPLRVVLMPCLFHVLLIISVSWNYFSRFSFINLLFGSLKKNCRFVFKTKVSKNITDSFLSFFLKKKPGFSWVSSFFVFYFFMHDLQKHVAIFLCLQPLFWKISWFFCRNPFVSVQKKCHLKKKRDPLDFSLLFLLNLFSLFVSYLNVYSPCGHSSYSPRFYFFTSFFSFHVSSPCVCSRYVYVLPLLCLLTIFLNRLNLFFSLFLKNTFICSSLFV